MPYWTPPIVNNWSKKGELPNSSPDRVESPITNRTGDVLAALPSWPSGAYQRPSRSSRWKFPEPPSGPPDCEIPIECIVPAVGNGRSIRVSRNNAMPNVERMQLLQRSDARRVSEPVNVAALQQLHPLDVVVAAQRREAGVRAGERLVVDAVGDEQASVAIAEDREPELETRAPTAQCPEVRDGVAQPSIVDVEGAGDTRLANRGVGIGDGEVADVLAELPLEVAFLSLTEQVRLVEPEKAAHPRALPDRCAEVDVAGVLLAH